ncbi:hypothetical protein [Pseudonocardia dioxanivorans]|uniref:hypothetical protein n=1 Tax=Pseudonocardia dioxanivorans TaxID=240495 RepID=UPI000CD1100D|nr:hypothetical protein [Pseudonocardia dioxanivorans]
MDDQLHGPAAIPADRLDDIVFSSTIEAELGAGRGLGACVMCDGSSITWWREQPLHRRCIVPMVDRLASAFWSEVDNP